MLPTPPELFRQFERGEISREELHATMAVHARTIIEEMVDTHRNPIKAYMERLRNRAAVRKWTKKYGPALFREILAALGQLEKFPPAQILWNANHSDMPLHCFIRSRIEPVFRITRMQIKPMEVKIQVEYGAHAFNRTTRETILLQRDAMLELGLAERILEQG